MKKTQAGREHGYGWTRWAGAWAFGALVPFASALLLGCAPGQVVISPAPPAPQSRPVEVEERAGEARHRREPEVAVRPQYLDFGRVEARASQTLDLEVVNQGRAELRIRRAWVEGPGFDEVLDGCSGRVLEPRRSCSLTVRFSPPGPGEYTGSAFVASDDRDERRLTVPLRGEGERRGRPEISVLPERVDFGGVETGRVRTQDVEIRNDGTAELRIREVVAQGTGFRIAASGCSGRPLPPGRSCVATVAFSPDEGRDYSGSLSIFSSDRDERRLDVPLFGRGRAPKLPDIAVNPARLDFGRLEAGRARTQEVEVRNSGREDLRVRDARVEGPAFSLASDGCSDRVLAPGRACVAVVRFAPGTGGTHVGRLSFASNDPDERRLDVPLAGQADQRTQPVVRVDPQTVDFGRVEAGKARSQDVTVKNDGRALLEVRRVAVEGAGFRLASDPCSGKALPPGGSCSVAVRFSPDRGGVSEGVLRVVSDDPDERRSRVGLRGEGAGRAQPASPQAGRGPCKTERLGPFAEDRRRQRMSADGELGDDACVTYEVAADPGALLVCVPEGLALEGTGFNPTRGGVCGDARLQGFLKTDTRRGETVSVTLRRGSQGPRKFKVFFELRKSARRGDRPDD